MTAATAAQMSVLSPAFSRAWSSVTPAGVGDQPGDRRRSVGRRAVEVGVAQPNQSCRQRLRVTIALVRFSGLDEIEQPALVVAGVDVGGNGLGSIRQGGDLHVESDRSAGARDRLPARAIRGHCPAPPALQVAGRSSDHSRSTSFSLSATIAASVPVSAFRR